jgi:transposase/gas vesicle protein
MGMSDQPRVLRPNRAQLELRPSDLESLLSEDHRARAILEFVEGLDLSAVYEEIRAVEGHAGRPAIDPAILVSLWIYATSEGVGSARALERLCEAHDAYRWICGGVAVSAHTLSDFRVAHGGVLDALLTQSVAQLMAEGLVELTHVTQDGIRVRASAGAGSYRRRQKLRTCLREAGRQVERLRRELDDDPAALSRREAVARQRAACERQGRVKQALARMREEEQSRSERAKARPQEKKKEVRVSTTDPEARVMRMADGGYRPAYNGQLAADSTSQIIVGVEVTTQATDHGQIGPMYEQIERRYGRSPEAMLVDGGFVALDDIDAVEQRGCRIYAPVMQRPRAARSRDRRRHRFDTPATLRWKRRMRTAGAKRLYGLRAATSECINAIARNRGLDKLRVRGREKVRAVLLWYALAHNALRALSLRAALE